MIETEHTMASPRPRRNLASALVISARPKQWIKNLLVLAAPVAAGTITDTRILKPSLVAFVAFTFVASGIYLINDVMDLEADKSHPKKSDRPIASGEVPLALAITIAVVLEIMGLAISFIFGNANLGLVITIYVAMNLAYSSFLKHEPVIDILVVALGFLLRAIAGGVADNVPLSNWFVIVASFSSLFVVIGKRYAESQLLGEDAAAHRASLGKYPIGFLNYARSLSSGVAITAYCLWAFERGTAAPKGALWIESSILFFVAAILRYALLIEQGHGGAPEDLLMSDRLLQVIGAIWILVLVIGIYLSR
ncbi:MAG: decaprenyl-phosphate phosphoribosyltransferase [Actinomycetota bacterium]|nr:MAG: decaprenyl-phosphate phosphoribosyltransferase [Actinomycetota bacterium]